MDKEISISRDLALSPSKGANFPYFYIWNHFSGILYFLISFILELL